MTEFLQSIGVFLGIIVAALILSEIFDAMGLSAQDYWEDGE